MAKTLQDWADIKIILGVVFSMPPYKITPGRQKEYAEHIGSTKQEKAIPL